MLQINFFNKANSTFSSKLVLAVALTFPSLAMSVQTTPVGIDTLINVSPKVEIEQVIRNHQDLDAQKKPKNPHWTCDGTLTNEQTGALKKVTVPTFGTGVETSQTATEYHFEQQDDRGVTSLTINKQTRKGSVTIFDVNGKVTHTGVLNNCH